MRLNDGRHLTYCGNIHPSDGLDDVLANLERYAVPLKARLAQTAPFGLGLRLSGAESREALMGDRLARMAELLAANDLYVFTLNGFPYGSFHRTPVKENVHRPDWRDPERADYTIRLARILAALLPESEEGSISSSPLSYGPWFGESASDWHEAVTGEEWETMLGQLVRVVHELLRLRQQGRYIHLDLEPEPDGLLENSREVVRFFQERLLPRGAELLADRAGLSRGEACRRLQEHVRVCFDTCHSAVVYEEPGQALARLRQAGVRVGKVQVSSALEVPLPVPGTGRKLLCETLRRFDEPTYLHQVVQQNLDGSFTRYRDLRDALANVDDHRATNWRVHFHVPVFLSHYGQLSSTQGAIVRTFSGLQPGDGTGHLEIETYTWGVLPDDLGLDLLDALEREYRWVLDVL
jgi:hypothetical protein